MGRSRALEFIQLKAQATEVCDMNHRKMQAGGQKTAQREKYLATGAKVFCPSKAGYRA